MKHADIHAALDAMRHQHPTSVTTVGPCWRCKQPARGNGPCKHCLEVELANDWKVPAALVSRLMAAHETARDAIAELQDVHELIVKAAGG